jgi:hypothetical protein
MASDSVKIKIAHGERHWSFDPNDWKISNDDLILRHNATQLTFGIGFDYAGTAKKTAANTYAVFVRSPSDERRHFAEIAASYAEHLPVFHLVGVPNRATQSSRRAPHETFPYQSSTYTT